MSRSARSLIALVLGLAFAGCGGGGGTAPRPIISMETDVVTPISSTYRAVFDCDARVTVNTTTANVGGTYVLESLGNLVTSPVNSLQGRPVRNTVTLSALGQSYTLTISEFIHLDGAGRWWSLGGEDAEGTRSWWAGEATYYPPPIDVTASGRILNQDARLGVGQTIDVPATDALSDDLSTVLFTRTSTREIIRIEVVDTPLGRFECYRIESTETIDLDDGFDPITVDFIRWERPDLGLVALQAGGIEVTYDTYEITLHQMDCVIRSHTP